MDNKYILSCESTADIPYSHMVERDIPVIFYTYTIDETEYVDNMSRDPKALDDFYGFIADGKLPTTSQINYHKYYDYFDGLLQKGDVLHINFSSGLTPSVNNAIQAAKALKEKYPERKISVIDSYCACSGYGLLVDEAADRRDAGMSFEELEKWVLDNRSKMHHQFFSTDLTMFRRGGRVSGPAAAVGTLLGICPIMHLNELGRIIAYDKVKGKKKAIAKTVNDILSHADGGSSYSGKFYIAHSNCIEMAEATKEAIKQAMPNIDGDIKIFDIGTIIASHTGVGTVACFFFGEDRNECAKKGK